MSGAVCMGDCCMPMLYEDGAPFTKIGSQIRTARKEHKCEWEDCFGVIPVGAEYVVRAYKGDDGEFWSEKHCWFHFG